MSSKLSLQQVNELPAEQFIKIFTNVVECWPFAAEYVSTKAPFESTDKLLDEFDQYLSDLPESSQENILQLHPDLAGKLADEGKLTEESSFEQASAGLNAMTKEQKIQMNNFNKIYKDKFGFPFVICVRQANRVDGILAGMNTRIYNSRSDELETGFNEVKKICKLRIEEIVNL